MPTAAPRYCTCGQHVVPAGKPCPCAIARKASSDADRPSPQARGYDATWRELRAQWLALHPDCVDCGDPATLVDHIISIRKAPQRRLDPTNFASMCGPCHGRKTARVDGSFGRQAA